MTRKSSLILKKRVLMYVPKHKRTLCRDGQYGPLPHPKKSQYWQNICSQNMFNDQNTPKTGVTHKKGLYTWTPHVLLTSRSHPPKIKMQHLTFGVIHRLNADRTHHLTRLALDPTRSQTWPHKKWWVLADSCHSKFVTAENDLVPPLRSPLTPTKPVTNPIGTPYW